MRKLPDYVIYDRLRQEREKEAEAERPRVYVPHYPHYPEELEKTDDKPKQHEKERGVVILQM